MDAATHARLINLLARTAREHDGEISAAARKANQLLGRLCLSWAEVISTRTPDPSAPAPREVQPRALVQRLCSRPAALPICASSHMHGITASRTAFASLRPATSKPSVNAA
jgi:hypothetical protein